MVPDYYTDGPHTANLEGRASSGPYPALSVCEEGVLTSQVTRNRTGQFLNATPKDAPSGDAEAAPNIETAGGDWPDLPLFGKRSGVPVLSPECRRRMIRGSEGPAGC